MNTKVFVGRSERRFFHKRAVLMNRMIKTDIQYNKIIKKNELKDTFTRRPYNKPKQEIIYYKIARKHVDIYTQVSKINN